MFSLFFSGLQQDFRIFLLAPLISAVFRTIFLWRYWPYRGKGLNGKGKAIWHCYRYGFWWGMDFHAYVFLVSMVAVSLPGAFIPAYYAVGNTVRLVGILVYSAVLLAAFIGKMIFYDHYHDIYNHLLWLGKNAEKHNLADVFFNENHGALWLLSFVPFLAVNWFLVRWLQVLPLLPLPEFGSAAAQYGFNTAAVLLSVAGFYFCRYGGTFIHDNKPEWDTIPGVVKKDIFLARATVDDLPQLEVVWKHPLQGVLTHTDEEDRRLIEGVLPPGKKWESGAPADVFCRRAKGARIKKPQNIFLIVGESYAQMALDEMYADFHIMDGAKKLRQDKHTAVLDNFLPAGMLSRPSIVSLMTGIFDARLELNERESFWAGTVRTSLPLQLKKLGYKSVYWYGGNATYGNFQEFAPAAGFDKIMAATDFCPPGSPMTWVGIYDHIFLQEAAKLIKKTDEPTFHYIYTTSNHGPYKIHLADYGYDADRVMPAVPENIRRNRADQQVLGTCWYSDRAISQFVAEIKEAFPDSLIIVTGDHAATPVPMDKGFIPRSGTTLRESCLTSFSMYHRELDQSILAGNTIGGHMNILPTIFELVAPEGFEYYSLFPSLLEPLDHVVSPYHWLTKTEVGLTDGWIYQPVAPSREQVESFTDNRGRDRFQAEIDGWCALTGYTVRHPELLRRAEELRQER